MLHKNLPYFYKIVRFMLENIYEDNSKPIRVLAENRSKDDTMFQYWSIEPEKTEPRIV